MKKSRSYAPGVRVAGVFVCASCFFFELMSLSGASRRYTKKTSTKQPERKMLRRTLLAVSAAFSAGAAFAADKVGIRPETVPSSAEYPRLRAGTQLDHLYESMLANGFGIKNPKASSDLPTVVIVSDTQCPWCSRLWNATMPLTDKVNFVWYLVPF